MADLTYVIDTILTVNGGQALGDLDRLGGKSKTLGDELFKVGGRLADGFTGAVEYVGRELMSAAKWGAAGAAAGGAYMIHFANEMEQLGISIAAILNAQGEVKGMPQGLQRSSDLLATMRKDAASLPGSFQDLTEIFRTISTPAMGAGMNSAAVEKFAANTMAVGAVMGLRSDVVGREMAMLLEGRASARNVLGARLGFIGDAAKEFNKLDEGTRAKKLTDALSKYAPAIEVFKDSFQALSTTFLDNVRSFGSLAVGPVFERIKSTLRDVNLWFENNQGTVSVWGHELGRWIGEAFDTGKRLIMEYGPAFMTFAGNAYDRFVEIWKDAEPYVKRIGEYIKDFLEDKGSVDKIIHLLELYAAVKVGGGAVGMLGGVGKTAAIGGALLGGGEGAAGGVASLGEVAVLATANIAIWSEVVSQASELQRNIAYEETADRNARLTRGYEYIEQLEELGAGTRAGVDAARGFDEIMHDLIADGDLLGASMLGAAAAAKSAAVDFQREQAQNDMATADAALRYVGIANASGLTDKIAKQNAEEMKKKQPRGGGGGGGGQTNTIYVTINSNQAPGQLSKALFASIAELRRNPTSSTFTKNFSSAANR